MVESFYHFSVNKPMQDLYLNSEGNKNYKLPGYIFQYLKDYQVDGVKFLFKHYINKQACILNDDSQLGKTLQTVAFLHTIFLQDHNKKCLIIVKNEDRIINWKFHFDLFSNINVKIINSNHDITNDSKTYLFKWNSLTRSIFLTDLNFDYIIIDNRDELLSNKIFFNFLLKNYLNKISLVIGSTDMSMDLKLLHSVLKLCGLLAKEFEDIKNFEDKFSLPTLNTYKGKNILEAYFIRREKIVNFCRDFRLRRYQHQYENILPLVTKDKYEKSIKVWKESNKKKEISSLYLAENTKEGICSAANGSEKFLEISKNVFNEEEIIEEDVEMSPLLFESDSDDLTNLNIQNEYNLENKEKNKSKTSTRKSKRNKKMIEPIDSFIPKTRSKSNSIITRSKVQNNKNINLDISKSSKRSTKNNKKIKNNQNKTDCTKVSSDNFHNQYDLSESSKYDFQIDLINKTQIENGGLHSQSEVHIINASNIQTVVLSSSPDETINKNKVDIVNNYSVNPSTDLFSDIDDYSITCSQKEPQKNKNQSSGNHKIKTCFIMLQKQQNKIKKNKAKESYEINVENEDIFDKTNEINDLSLGLATQARDKNKITKYFFGNEQMSFSSKSNSSGNLTEDGHITPRRRKLQKQKLNSSKKKSPYLNSSDISPNGLLKWLNKRPESSNGSLIKRRLEISFKKL